MNGWFPAAITARHARILDHLDGGEVLTATELSRLVNASHRTVYRDIVTLRRAGHKIIGAAGFGFMLKGKRTMIGPTGKFPHGKLDPTDEGETVARRRLRLHRTTSCASSSASRSHGWHWTRRQRSSWAIC